MTHVPIQADPRPPAMHDVPSLDPEVFTRAFRNHPAGVAIITADPGDGPVGLTASSVISVSVDPPLLAVSVSDRSSCADALRRSNTVVVHLLGADQVDLAKLCAADPGARFADAKVWERLSTAEPCFKESANWIRGEVVDRIRAGSATLMVVRALSAKPSERPDESDTFDALIYHNRTWRRLRDTVVS